VLPSVVIRGAPRAYSSGQALCPPAQTLCRASGKDNPWQAERRQEFE